MTSRFLPFVGLLLLSFPMGCGEQGTLEPSDESEGRAVARTGVLVVAADLDDRLDELVDGSGASLGFAADHELRLRWAGAAGALVTDLWSPDGERLDIKGGDTIVISDGISVASGTFNSSWTLAELAQLIEVTLNFVLGTETDTEVEVLNDGTLRFVNPSGGNSSDITVSVSSPQCTIFNSMIDAVPVSDGGEGLSRPICVMAEVVRGEDGATVENLRDGLQAALQVGAAGAEVLYAAGRLVIENPTLSSHDLHGVWLENLSSPGLLENAIGLWGVSLRRGETFTTPRKLLAQALASEALVDILDREGNSTGLAPQDEVVLSAVVNGRLVDSVRFVISTAGDGSHNDGLVWTVEGLIGEIASALPLHAAQGAAIEEGRVILRTDEGALISDLALAAESAPGFGEVFRFAVE